MKLYLLPISTRRTLIYAQRLQPSGALSSTPTYLDKATTRAAKLWAGWEQKDSGWQRKVVDWGNKAMKRIPFEEWGLKSIPPLSARRDKKEGAELTERERMVEVEFPGVVIPESKVLEVLRKIGSEREALHRKRLVWCVVGMPISAPIALVPVIPNLPFFYLVYRAWSHYRALAGGKHIQYLLSHSLLTPNPSPILDTLYSSSIMRHPRGTITLDARTANATPEESRPLLAKEGTEQEEDLEPEVLLLGKGDSERIARTLEMPELHAEIDRAIWQVQRSMRSEKELAEERESLKQEAKDDLAEGRKAAKDTADKVVNGTRKD